MRRFHTFSASRAATVAVSSWVTPTKINSPGAAIDPTTSPATATCAEATR